MAAAMTEPPGPGRSPPPLIHVGWIRNASSMALTPPSLMPPPLIPGYVERPSMSPMVSPASAIAFEAGVDGQRKRVDHEPPAEGGATDAAEDGPVLEALVAQGRAGERPYRFGDTVDRIHRPRQPEQGEPHVLLLEELDRDLLADLHLGRLAADDVRRQVHAWVLGQRDVGDHVRRFEVGQPTMGVDRVADDGAAARDRGRLGRPAPAVGADGHRWMHQLAAVAALLDAERAVGSGGPEPLVGRGQLRQGSHGRSSPGSRVQY